MSLLTATRSETTKQFTTSMWWILALVLVVYVASTAGALGFVIAQAGAGGLSPDAPAFPEDAIPALLYSTATSVGYVFPLLIGTLMVTTEFRHKTLTPTFLAVPRRGTVLAAKIATGILIGALYGAVGIVAAVAPSAGILAAFDIDTALGTSDTWALLGRMMLAFVLWVFIGIGVGTLVRNQVGAIVGVLVFTQFVEPIVRTAAAFAEDIEPFTRYLPGAASDTLVGASVLNVAMPASSDALEWWAGGLVLLGYAVVFLVLGALFSWRRDVS
ncbi:ABC transporter permease subunit [Microbacterium sp. C7(2022)]|uniref:ABC transporter permease subunit n=1 Tax=Microbacterium sp. C7(2022) TaxID=2992759 RepID=UPI00237BD91A|nr:ABC transporter permease subunit [Microbacterium sp. C7(2022)]MDE0546553.1 ABC transporter permease [Microbacterium sp. C7(2022)]